MRKTIRNLLLVSLFFFALASGSCSVGVSYDERNKLYPETNWVGSDLAIGVVFGKRWERVGNALFIFGALIGIVASVVWYRSEESVDKSILQLVQEE